MRHDETLRALIAKWRKQGYEFSDRGQSQSMLYCANELEALLPVDRPRGHEQERWSDFDIVRWLRTASKEQLKAALNSHLQEQADPTRVDKEFCICAALRLQDGRVIRGHRHDDCIQTALKWKDAGQDIGNIRDSDQGFVTSRGRFVDRARAMQIQRACFDKAPAGHMLVGEILFSEDLY